MMRVNKDMPMRSIYLTLARLIHSVFFDLVENIFRVVT